MRISDFIKRYLPDNYVIRFLYWRRLGRWPNLKNPQLLTEKMQWLKLNDRTPLHTVCADKLKVRDYVKDKIGDKYLIPLVISTDNVNDICEANLPDYPVIVKVNHDSGGTFIIRDRSKVDFDRARQNLKSALKKNYYYSSKEWVYKNIEKRVVVEKLLLDEKGNIPDDIKIHCFNGKVVFVEIMTDRDSLNGVKEHCITRDFKKQPFLFSYPQSDKPLLKPEKWDEAMELAEKLALEFRYVRVDFYCVLGELFFGELTFYPHSGVNMYLQPREWDKKLGDLLNLKNNCEE